MPRQDYDGLNIPDPNCSLGSGVGLKCVHWLPSGSFSEAEERCGELEMKLWPGPARDLAQVNKKIEAELDGPVWVRAETESLYEEERATQTQTVEGKRGRWIFTPSLS